MLRATQVCDPQPSSRFTVPVTMYGKVVEALINTWCGGDPNENGQEGLHMGQQDPPHEVCTWGHERLSYQVGELVRGGQLYHFKVAKVPHLDCVMLVGWDCPTLPQLL